jgi:hypothetical protein
MGRRTGRYPPGHLHAGRRRAAGCAVTTSTWPASRLAIRQRRSRRQAANPPGPVNLRSFKKSLRFLGHSLAIIRTGTSVPRSRLHFAAGGMIFDN